MFGTAQLSELVAAVEAEPQLSERLPLAEQLAVAIVLRRMEWLRQRGIHTIWQAQSEVGAAVWQACRDVQKQRLGRQ